MTKSYKELQSSSAFEGDNAAYLESLYEQYVQDPHSLSAEWQQYFAKQFQNVQSEPIHSQVREYFLTLPKAKQAPAANTAGSEQQLKVFHLIQAYRQFGHLRAKVDPLNLTPIPNLDALSLQHYGLNEQDQSLYATDQLAGLATATIKKIVDLCQKIYCGSVGFEYQHIESPEEVKWLRARIEKFPEWKLSAPQKIDLLKQLTATEGLEKALGARYVGVTRFSIEGGDTQIPLLNQLICQSTQHGAKEVVIGMAHRGRLNVLANVFGMSTQNIIAQFEGNYKYHESRSDDVKYHYGYSADLATPYGPVHASLGFNPSHLEIISPVVQGSVRARQDRRNDTRREQVLAVQLHGDSAFAGQGVVMETFALSQTRGFKVGGSVHLVVNNQVGFTTSNPQDTRSSLYCTDIAKMVSAPVFHLNSDDPEAALFVAQLALEYHFAFRKDVVIDLVCYRRYGHNEGDEPSATQPLMYQVIKQLPSVRKLYADQLIQQGVINQAQADEMVTQYRESIDKGHMLIQHVANPEYAEYQPDWSIYENTSWQAPAKTALSKEEFAEIAAKITELPAGFKLQAQVARAIANRATAYEGKAPLIWGDAEMLAYASLLTDGYRVRLVGQDSGRGTFAHRHAVVYDQATGAPYISLDHLSPSQASFNVIDSVLSENGVMAFEYGYASTEPRSLVLWEAQYGDFVNGAQVVIDQFLSSSEQKWGRFCGLVLLLPHGYEGAGPEHSSARLERFLQLCAQDNMQVCVPSTPAQIFHLLRRQVLRPYRKPLIILTPKSILRKTTSSIEEILNGEFKLVIPPANAAVGNVQRVIVCSGKVYFDLEEKRQALGKDDTAIIRLEQLYPFPTEALQAELRKYKNAKTFVWCQEEPENQGAWRQIRHQLNNSCPAKHAFIYAGREEAASTAAGYKKLHEKQLAKFLEEVFSI